MNKMNTTYRQVGDYRIPNLTLPPDEAKIRLGKWGMLHKDYLQKHKPVLFATLLAQSKLYQHLAQIDQQANEMFDSLVEQLMKSEGVSEELKERDQMEWVQRMNSIQEKTNEIVCNEMIYA